MAKPNEPLIRELALIPRWMLVPAALIVVAVAGVLLFAFQHESNPPPLAFQILFSLFIASVVGSVLAVLVLGVGYVNRDARRRGMNPTLWTLLVIFVPNAIGFILYFLLRPPLPVSCPGCGGLAPAGSRFCTACGRPLVPTCPGCGSPRVEAHAYCANCGRALRE